ncbi:MAG: hypothetical protein DRH50_16745 [Deltaproteobacteria bacterium]|nr:MAG: hypothetical protein DRH50_16745 [Deltaproteobacteria bacterium]
MPAVYIASRVAQASRARVFRFFLDHFLIHVRATMTAIRVAHAYYESSIRVDQQSVGRAYKIFVAY